MAVFSPFLGDPFNYEMDDDSFYDAVFDVSSDVFTYAAGRRLWTQQIAYDALTNRTYDVRRWITHGDTDPTFEQWMEFGIIVSIVTAVTTAPYLSVWFAPVALALDAYNIYQYFD